MVYTFRIDYADGTFSVEDVTPEDEMLATAYWQVRRGLVEGDWVSLIGMRDLRPQEALAF